MEAAYVLHRWPYQESSLLVELLSAEQGRFRVVAKGARRAKSRWRAVLQPFQPIQINSRGRGDLQTLTQAEADGHAHQLQGRQLYSGFYVNELVQRLTSPYQVVDGLFADYHQTLTLLQNHSEVEPVLRRFEWQLICHLGHGFDWQTDCYGDPIRIDSHYQFMPESGFQPVADTKMIRGELLQQMAAMQWHDSEVLHWLKVIMRQALAPYLGDQPLRSRQLFAQFKGVKDASHPSD